MTASNVAVIIPAYNGASWIARALSSVLQQSCQPSEIIVVDDGSTDDTAHIAASFPRVRVISQSNQERGASRNIGIRATESAWIALLDADDQWLPEHLECALRKLRDDKADVTCGAYQVVDSSGQTLWVTHPWSETEFQDPLRIFERVQFGGLCASNVVARRALFETFPFDERRQMAGAEDWHWFARLCGAVSIKPFHQCSVRYHLHGSNSVLQAERMAGAMRAALADLLTSSRFRGRGTLPRRQIECRLAAELGAAGEHRRAMLTLLRLAGTDPRCVVTHQWWRLFTRALDAAASPASGLGPGDH